MTSEGTDTSKFGDDPGGLWAEAAALDFGWGSVDLDAQRAWARAIAADFPPDGDITCDPWTLMPMDELNIISVGAVGPRPELLEVALDRASERMGQVFDNGWEATGDMESEELPDWFDDSLLETGSEPYNPNYVSGPERTGDVVGIANIDTKGERYPWMFRTFLRIVAEELRAAHAVPARIIPFFTPDWLAWMREHGVTYPSHDQLA
jgi:hypothetical protein